MNRIIAISGPPGAGKSTLAHYLSAHMDAAFIEYDLYQSVTDQDPAEIYKLMQAESGYDRLEIPRLVDALAGLKAGNNIMHPLTGDLISASNTIIFETPLGRQHTATGRYIDLLVWIDLPLDLALARILHSHLDSHLRSGSALLAKQVEWSCGYLQSYIEYVHDMLIVQQQRVASDADIIIDGRLGTEPQLRSVLRQLDANAEG